MRPRMFPWLVVGAVVVACGARSQLDGAGDASTPDTDATTTFDAPPDVRDAQNDVAVIDASPLSVSCDGGYFVEVIDDDRGATVLRHNQCWGDGQPSEACALVNEDCAARAIHADNGVYDGGYEGIGLPEPYSSCGCAPLGAGDASAWASVTIGAEYWAGSGSIDILTVGDAAVTGAYDVSIEQWLDGGFQPPHRHLHGTFCVASDVPAGLCP